MVEIIENNDKAKAKNFIKYVEEFIEDNKERFSFLIYLLENSSINHDNTTIRFFNEQLLRWQDNVSQRIQIEVDNKNSPKVPVSAPQPQSSSSISQSSGSSSQSMEIG